MLLKRGFVSNLIRLIVVSYCFAGSQGCTKKRQQPTITAFDVSTSGRSVAVAGSSGDRSSLLVVDAGNNDMHKVAESQGEIGHPVFSPDGKMLVYSEEHPNGAQSGARLARVSTDGGEALQLTKFSGKYDSSPLFTKNGGGLVFARAHRSRPGGLGGVRWTDWDVFAVKLDGTDVERRTHKRFAVLELERVNSDGSELEFSAISSYDSKDISAYLWMCNSNTTSATIKKVRALQEHEPIRVPDGFVQTRFISDSAGNSVVEIFYLGRNMKVKRQLTALAGECSDAKVTTDGFVWFKFKDGLSIPSVWRVRLGGGDPECMVTTAAFN